MRPFNTLIFLFTLLSAIGSYAQAWRSAYYPTTWAPPATANFYTDAFIQDYSYAGYQWGEKPIPSPAVPIYDVTKAPYNADKTGATDATTAIQAAINDAQTNGKGIVYLPTGTYQVNPGIKTSCLQINKSNICLKGDGPGKTYLFNNTYQMKGKAIISVSGSSSSSWTNTPTTKALLTADVMNPTRVIPVDNPGLFAVGDLVVVRNFINDSWITEHKEDGWLGYGSQLQGLMYGRYITAIDLTKKTITIDVPLRYALKTRDNSCVFKLSGMISEVGISDFSIGNIQHPATTGYGENDYGVVGTAGYDCDGSFVIKFNTVVNSWMRNVQTYKPAANTTGANMLSNGVLVAFSKNLTIANCNFNHAQYGGGNGNGYGYRVSANEVLITSCTSNFVRHGFVFSSMWCSGNVFHGCSDIQSGKQCGSTGNEKTSGWGSDHHMHFSQSNLIDQSLSDNSAYIAYYRNYGSNPKHLLTSTHTTYWNISSAGTMGYCVWTQQSRYGYAIGTSGTSSTVKTNENLTGSAAKTDPVDIVEGPGTGSRLVPQSLYLDQLALRMGSVPVCTTPSPLVTSPIYYCQRAVAAPVTATGTALKWYTVSVGGTALSSTPVPITTAVGTTLFFVSQTINGCESTRAMLSVNVSALTNATVSIASSATTVCSGTGVNLTATGLNGGTSMTYTWFKNAAPVATGRTYSYIPSNGDLISVRLTAGGTLPSCLASTTVASSPVSITVNPLVYPSLVAMPSANAVCSGTGVTFTVTGSNWGTSPSIRWWRNLATTVTGTSFSVIPNQGDIVWAVVSVSGIVPSCLGATTASSNLNPMTVNPTLTSAVVISPSAVSVCSGTGISLTASGTNLGSVPQVVWWVNNLAVATGKTFAYVPSDNDFVKAIATASGTGTNCLSNPVSQYSISVNVDPILPTSVGLMASANPVCSGTGVVYSAVPINLGSTPKYSWSVNGIVSLGTSSTFGYTPANADIVLVSATAGGVIPACLSNPIATSAGIISLVNSNIPTTISIFANSTTVCKGQSITFTSSATGTGSTPTYRWYVNSVLTQSGNQPSYTYTPASGDVVQAVLVMGGSGNACISGGSATSAGIAIVVNTTVTSSIAISSSSTTLCSGAPVFFTASGINAGTNPNFAWFVNGQLQGSGKTFTYVPSNGNSVYAKMTIGSGISCVTNPISTSLGTILTVNPILTPSVSVVSSANSICSGTGASFTATGVNLGTSTGYLWWVNGNPSASGPVFSYIPSDGDLVTVTITTAGTGIFCLSTSTATSSGLRLQVNPWTTPTVSISNPLPQICSGTGVTFAAVSSQLGSLPSYGWMVNGVARGFGATFSYVPSSDDRVICSVTTGGLGLSCNSTPVAVSNELRLTVYPVQRPTVGILQTIGTVCSGAFVTFTASGSNAGSFPSYAWMVNDSLMGSGATFGFVTKELDKVQVKMAVDTVGLGCYSVLETTSDSVKISVTPKSFASILVEASMLSLCPGQQVSFTATGTNCGTNPSFEWIVNGNYQNSGASFAYVPQDLDVVNAALTVGGDGITCVDTAPVLSDDIELTVIPSGQAPCVGPEIGTITGPALVLPQTSSVVYSVGSVSGVTYTWSLPTGMILVSGQGTYSIVVAYAGTVNGFVTVTAANTFGTTVDSLGIASSTVTALAGEGGLGDLTIYPNPSSSNFYIEYKSIASSPSNMELLDMNGFTIQKWEGVHTPIRLTLGAGLPSGIYMLVVTQEGIKQMKKMVKLN